MSTIYLSPTANDSNDSRYFPGGEIQQDWKQKYRCDVCLIREDGAFSAIVLNLPGTRSRGGSEEEAWENVREAITAVIQSHIESGEEIPWIESRSLEAPAGATVRRWISVDAESACEDDDADDLAALRDSLAGPGDATDFEQVRKELDL